MKEKPELSPQFWQLLADTRPYGLDVTAADVRSWFDVTWPTYSTYRYKRHKRTIASWWSHAREREIEAAIERRITLEDEASTAALESRLDGTDAPPVTDHYLKLVGD